MGTEGIMDQEGEEAKTPTSDNVQEGPVAPVTELELTVSTLQAGLKERATEIESLNDRLLRLQAEFENYKKRAARERGEFVRFAVRKSKSRLSPEVIKKRWLATTAFE